MAKTKKASRKGKKQWRKNIPTEEHDAFVEAAGKEARSGGPVDVLPDEAIFFVDKEKDAVLERKVHRARKKGLLHCESVLQRKSLVPPVTWSDRKKPVAEGAAVTKPKSQRAPSTVHAEKEKVGQKRKGAYDIWGEKPGKQKVSRPVVNVPAVEVDPPGCSFNPQYEDHQAVLAKAVADEVQKALKRELEPEVPRLLAEGAPGANDEEDLYFLDVDDAPETAGHDEEGDEEPADNNAASRGRTKKLTQADLNRRLRVRELQAQETKRKDQKKQRQDLAMLPELVKSVDDEEQEQEMRRLRRKTAADERATEAPPRLGKRRFQPEPVQVLLSEEVTGSLRQLKGCYTLVKDRFKSLQRRGILEPRLPAKKRQSRKRVSYVQGTKGDKERQMHADLLAERAARKQGKAMEIFE